MIKPTFIAIAGGTGAGKSTLSTALMDKYPKEIGLVQLDDYFKPPAEVPKVGEHLNYDHPDALYIDRLHHDLKLLGHGAPVMISTKNERRNPKYAETKERIWDLFYPQQIMLVEGYLTLYDERIRSVLNTSIWLEVDHDTRWGRRVHFKNSDYEQNILKPMHKQFAEPTKQYAEHVIDVTNQPKEKVLKRVEEILKPLLQQ